MNVCLTVEEAARLIRAKIGHVYYLAYMGQIEGWKIRGTWRLFGESVEAYAQRRNEGKIDFSIAGDPFHQGCGGVPTLFGFDYPADDLGQADQRLPCGQRMEYQPRRLPRVPVQALKPLANTHQMDLFAEAV